VDGIERDLQGRARMVRVDVSSRTGAQIALQAAIRGVPTLIVYDGRGEPALRQVGRPNREAVVSLVARLKGP